MIGMALRIAAKDLRLTFKRSSSLIQAILLGFLLIFLFSLARETARQTSPLEAATIFWLATLFCQLLLFNQLYAFEEEEKARFYLLLLANPVQSIWLGKFFAAFSLLLLSQTVFLGGIIIFLNQQAGENFPIFFAAVPICDFGICALGSLLGALGYGGAGKESLLAIIIFPLLTPILLAGINLCSLAFCGENIDARLWLGLGLAFDSIFAAASLLLFNFIYQE